MVSILIVEDHQIMREGLRSLLESVPDFVVCGETSRGSEVIPLVEQLQPDIIVLDLGLPDIGGIEVLRQLESRASTARTVVLSMHADSENVLEALQNGAWAYVLKDYGVTELTRAVREVMQGHHYLSPVLSDYVILSVVKQKDMMKITPGERSAFLTPREWEVLKLAAAGHETQEIAALLSVSASTVKTHRSNLMQKLNLHSQAALTRYAFDHGILNIRPEHHN